MYNAKLLTQFIKKWEQRVELDKGTDELGNRDQRKYQAIFSFIAKRP